LNSETTIAASNGERFPAVELFSFALRYFKEHALKELSAQSATIIVNEDVRWVITVPAIWRAPAKQLMRHAAYEVIIIILIIILIITRRALGRAHVPPTKLFRRLAVNKIIVKPLVAAAQYL